MAHSVRKLDYRLKDRPSVSGRFNNGNFSIYHRVQTGSEAHPTSNPIGTGGFYPGYKAAEA
jgi:hypothetical protein